MDGAQLVNILVSLRRKRAFSCRRAARAGGGQLAGAPAAPAPLSRHSADVTAVDNR